MEVIRALNELYEKARQEVAYIETNKSWVKLDYNFDEDPPCIVALLENGTFEIGTINMVQMRLAAYLKIKGITLSNTIAILDEWLLTVKPEYIYEYSPNTRLVDLTQLKEQNRHVCRTVFTGSQYGFSCPGIKQIPGIEKYCEEKCQEKKVNKVDVTLFDATKAEHRHRRLNIIAECIGRQDHNLIIPNKIKATCMGQRMSEEVCGDCALSGTKGMEVEFSVDAASTKVLQFLEPSKTPLAGKIGALVGTPRRHCSRWKYTITEQNAETIYITPRVANEYSDSDRHTRQMAYYIGHGLQTNQAYKFSGYCHVNENSNLTRLVFDEAIETVDSLREFKRTNAMVNQSKIFAPNQRSIWDKYMEIIKTLEYNHIRIWGRESMIMAIDLAYHSVRRLYFQRQYLKGWLNVLIIGDSGQAKSKAAEVLMRYYNLGYKTSAEGATRAGTLWGVDTKSGGPSALIWGSIPRNTGRLVIIDELKEMILNNTFRQLTEARSSGVVNVDTIVSGRAMAETRLVMLTNPLEKKKMNDYMYPVEAIQDLIPDLEDTRRFDFVVGVASKEVDDEVLHRDINKMKEVEDKYKSDVCKNHILWIWNLAPEDIIIPPSVEAFTLQKSLEMCKLYSPDIPIVEPADQREKLIRIAAAFAARLNSVNKEQQLLVTEEYVETAFKFMNVLYKSEALLYLDFSEANAIYSLDSDTIDELLGEFRSRDWSPYWRRMVLYMSEENYIHARTMAAAVGCNIKLCIQALDWFVVYKLCKMISGQRYTKTGNGVTFLRAVKQKEDISLATMDIKYEPPEDADNFTDNDHIKEGEMF